MIKNISKPKFTYIQVTPLKYVHYWTILLALANQRAIMILKSISFKVLLSIILNLSIVIVLPAQKSDQQIIDSLLTELPLAESDTSKVNLLNEISYTYKRLDSEKGLEYGQESLVLANQLNWTKGKAISLNSIGINYFFKKDYLQAIPSLVQSLEFSEQIQLTPKIAQNAMVLGLCYEWTDQYELSLINYKKSIKPYSQINSSTAATALYNTANMYSLMSKHSEVLTAANELYEYCKEYNIESRQGDAFYLKGAAYLELSNYPLALQNLFEAARIFEAVDKRKGLIDVYLSIGVVFQTQKDFDKALEYYNKSLVLSKELGDEESSALNLSDIGSVYHQMGDYEKARSYYNQALDIYEEYENHRNVDMTVYNIGGIYLSEEDYENALVYFARALKAAQATGDEFQAGVILGLTGYTYHLLGLENDSTLLMNFFDGDKIKAHETSLLYTDSAIAILTEEGELKNRAFYLDQKSMIESELKLYSAALDSYKQFVEINDSLFNIERDKKLVQAEMGYEFGRREDSLNLASAKQQLELQNKIDLQALTFEYETKEAAARSEKEKQQLAYEEAIKREKIQNEYTRKQAEAEAIAQQRELELKQAEALNKVELRRQRNIRNFTLVGASGLLLFSIVVFRQRNKVKKEKARSEALLLNILPAEIAEELKAKGKADARDFDMVSILFTDFKGFTEASAKLNAQDLVAEINTCFEAFDATMDHLGIEKIKTIGDAYMAAGGLPVSTEDSVKNTVLAALEMQSFIRKRKVELDAQDSPAFEMRLGIHTGPVVAGIVGIKKFQYDIWGDTVNTASRMESSGEVGKVNISQTTYNLLKDDPDFSFESRGKIEAKGKGEMHMWFVRMNSLSSA